MALPGKFRGWVIVISIIVIFLLVRSLINLPHASTSEAGAPDKQITGKSPGKHNSTYDVSKLSLEDFNSIVYSNKHDTVTAHTTYIEDVLLMVKSTKIYHGDRLQLALDTWISLAEDSVYVLTDADDENYEQILGKEHFINSGCRASHDRDDLMCKLQKGFNVFMNHIERYKWFCFVDDDTYVVVPNLVEMLREYDSEKSWYIGKPSLPYTFQAYLYTLIPHIIEYEFATGGSGLCISRGTVKKMIPLCRDEEFLQRGREIKGADDTALGYVINYLLGIPLTVVSEMHSHLEAMWRIDPLDFHKQVTLSWGEVVFEGVIHHANNVVIRREIPQFPEHKDKTRMKTVHCHLYPGSEQCLKFQQQLGPMIGSSKETHGD